MTHMTTEHKPAPDGPDVAAAVRRVQVLSDKVQRYLARRLEVNPTDLSAMEHLLESGQYSSIAELAAHLRIPLGTARVLVGDLASSGHLTIHRPRRTADTRPDRVILERLLDGLRAR